jgi:ubiquinone/menaquinone biosynthesis C-methylase UbiE
MPDFQTIYAEYADEYDALVQHEDYEGNILAALRPIAGLDQPIDVVELGAGTGRLSLLLAPYARSLKLFDASDVMLAVAMGKLIEGGYEHWTTKTADNRAIPLEDEVADLSIAGWSFGHSTEWYPDTWRDEIRAAVNELLRVLRPNGVAVILETMGTGREEPEPPSADLAAYYQLLEQELGFSYTWIRTDYRFDSAAQAKGLTGFFFGNELVGNVLPTGEAILPECTGIWWRSKEV